MTALREILQERGGNKLRQGDSRKIAVPATLHVLFLGPEDPEDDMYNLLLHRLQFRVLLTSDCQELWLLPSGEVFHLAILHSTLSDLDLEVGSRIIRQKWADAKILVIRNDADLLDEDLYDARLDSTAEAATFLETVRRLLSMRCYA